MPPTGKDDPIWPPQGVATAVRPEAPRRAPARDFIAWPDEAGSRNDADDWADRVAAIWGEAEADLGAPPVANAAPASTGTPGFPPAPSAPPPARVYAASLNEQLGLQGHRETIGWSGLEAPDLMESLRAAAADHLPAEPPIEEKADTLPVTEVELLAPETNRVVPAAKDPIVIRPAGPGLLTPDEIWEMAARELGNRTLGSSAPGGPVTPVADAEPPVAAPLDLLRPAALLPEPQQVLPAAAEPVADFPSAPAPEPLPERKPSPFSLVLPELAPPEARDDDPAAAVAELEDANDAAGPVFTLPPRREPGQTALKLPAEPAAVEPLSFPKPAPARRRGRGRALFFLLLLAGLGAAGWIFRADLARLDWGAIGAKIRETFVPEPASPTATPGTAPAMAPVPPAAREAAPPAPPADAPPPPDEPVETEATEPSQREASAEPAAAPAAADASPAAETDAPPEGEAPEPPPSAPSGSEADDPPAAPVKTGAAGSKKADDGRISLLAKPEQPAETHISLLMTGRDVPETAAAPEKKAATPFLRAQLPPSTPDVAKAQAEVEAVLRAATVDELLPHIVDRERVEPAVREYYSTRRLEPLLGTVVELQISARIPSRDVQAHVFSVFHPEHERGFSVSAEATDEGYRVDWESYIQWRDRWLEKFLRQKGSEPQELFVVLRRSHYFDSDVPTASDKLCFQLTATRGDEGTFAFTDRQSPAGRQLAETYAWQKMYFPVVELQWVRPANGKPWVRLNRVVRPSWRRGN